MDPHLPANEYDWLIHPLRERLIRGADVGEIAAFLRESVRERYGVDSAPGETAKISERLAAVSMDETK